ncbi:MAG: Cys-Gln thioester bond-forming surface protein, partial [Anaerotignum sp.]|nr:Cys-Gln thioester bond-forming surface protein [Anaerotignum sp.]
MAKTKQTRRMIAMALAAAVTMSSMPVAAFAAEDGGSEGGSISASSDSGSEGGSDSTPAGGSDSASDSDSASSIPSAPAEGETPVAKDEPINITVKIPSAEEGTNTENFGNEVGTATGDLPEGPDDDEYDYEVTTQQGSVTVEATENTEGENNVEFVTGVTGPTAENDIIYEQGYFDKAEQYYKENELEIEDFLPAVGNEEVTPDELGQLEIPDEDDESRYELITQGATSQFRPLAVYTKPMTDEDKVAEYGDAAYIKQGECYFSYYVKWLDAETRDSIAKNEDGSYATDAEGYLVDKDGVRIVKKEQTVTVGGETYYMHRFDLSTYTINGAYNDADGDGTWETDSTKYKGVWEEAAQFVLVDKVTGELITAYQEDYVVKKWTTGVEYYMQDLEDSEKFGEYADNIRAVAQAGYWGTAEGIGSLASMKAMLKEAGFNDAELESLTDGVALAATQMAIYYYTNAKFGQEFINTNYDGTPDTLIAQWGAAGGAVPADKQDEAALMFKVYDFLKNLDPVAAGTKVENIISNENFLAGDMEITVLEKVDDHENNQDDNDKNDAYTTNLTFALVVTPSTENGDDLVVKVVNANTGEVIASGRVAGEQQEGENYLTADANGNYTFENIVMTEGDHQYNITMEGIQNLKEGGVYLFTADVPEDTRPQPSMIGMTSDKNQVNVESLNFSFEVDDEKVVVREK